VESNYATGTVQNAGAYFDNFVYGLDKFPHQRFAPHWQSPPLHLRATEYDGAGSAYFAGMSIVASGSGSRLKALTGFSFTDNYVEFNSGRAVGRMVDVRQKKRYMLRRDVEASNGGRWIILCFDSSVAQLTSAGGAHPYAVSDVSTPLQYDSNFGGCYQTGGDGTDDIFVSFKDDVKFAWIGLMGGTAVCRARSIGFQSIDGGTLTTFQGFTDSGGARFYNDDALYATGAPATNIGINYPDGLNIERADGTAAGAPGWKVTTGGTVGTAVFKVRASVAA
jgi:hypothetical protein